MSGFDIRRWRIAPALLAATGFWLAGVGTTAWATEYVKVTRATANIRSSASTSGRLVAQARRGDVFLLEGVEGKWYRIHLFSGGERYLFTNLAQVTAFDPEELPEPSVRREVYQGWFAAERKAKAEAAKRFPPERDLEKHLEYAERLNDRYKLELMHRYQVAPAAYRRIILEGNLQGWLAPE